MVMVVSVVRCCSNVVAVVKTLVVEMLLVLVVPVVQQKVSPLVVVVGVVGCQWRQVVEERVLLNQVPSKIKK